MTNPVVDAVAEREAELIDRLTVRANILHASAAWGSDADALLMQQAAKALARHRQSADTALVEAAKDALAGWQYIRRQHGDLYGVGWDRVENALTDALTRGERT